MATKDKHSFSIGGIKYTDIKGSLIGDRLYIGVGGTSQMILQWMKKKYSSLPKQNYYAIKSRSFAGGNSIHVYLNNAPETFAIELKHELEAHFEYSSKHYASKYSATKMAENTDEGMPISYGTKYFNLSNSPQSDAKGNDVDWDILKEPRKSPNPTPKTSDTPKPTYPIGEVLKDCSGWLISKKNLPDSRIVYNVKIKPDTPVNREQWQEIKNEIYLNTGFKWSYGSFQKWGQIASEAAVFEIICNTLGKYYSKSQSTETESKSESKEEKNSNEEEQKYTSKSSKENIQKAIKGLQYLADKGNEKAAKAIKGLEYLLNK